MKRIAVLFFITMSVVGNAQVRIGAIGGVHFSDINNMDLVSTGRQTNLHLGIMSDFKFDKSDFHILTGAIYCPMGYAKSNFPVVDNLGNQYSTINSHRIGYIQLPVYFLYGAAGKKSTINGGLGPFIAIKTGDKLKVAGDATFSNDELLPIGVKAVKSVVSGVGVHLSGEVSSFLIAAQYQKSFTDIYENQSGKNNWKVNSFGISIGYFFTR